MQEEEVQLIDVLSILWKRKALIIIGTLLLTLVAAGVSLFLPKVYEITSIIEPGTRPITDGNGQITSEKPFVAPETIKESILGGAFDQIIQKKLNIPIEEYPEFEVVIPKNTSLVKISVESSMPQKTLDILTELVALISAEGQEKLEIEKNQVKNEIKLAHINEQKLDGKIKLVQKQLTETSEKINSLEKDKKNSILSNPNNAMSVLLYSNEIQNQQIYLNNLQEKLKDLEAAAQGSNVRIDNFRLKLERIKSAHVKKIPTFSEKPNKPKKVIIVALVFIFSLFGSILVAIFLDYIERVEGK